MSNLNKYSANQNLDIISDSVDNDGISNQEIAIFGYVINRLNPNVVVNMIDDNTTLILNAPNRSTFKFNAIVDASMDFGVETGQTGRVRNEGLYSIFEINGECDNFGGVKEVELNNWDSFGDYVHNGYFFTVKNEFNEEQYMKGNQTVYFMRNFKSAFGSAFDNENGKHSFELYSVKAVENTKKNFRIIIKQDIRNVVQNETVNSDKINYVELGLDPALYSRIKIDAYSNNHNIPIKLKTEQPLIPIMATTTAVGNNINIDVVWFDTDIVAPYIIAKQFINAKSLKKVSDISGVSQGGAFLYDEIIDMMTVSYIYSRNFADIPHLQDGSIGNAGKINPATTVGHSRTYISDLQNMQEHAINQNIIDQGIFKDYGGRILTSEDVINKSKVTREIIAMLSSYISCTTYTVGKYRGFFNRAYLPWYLVNYNLISLSTTTYKEGNTDYTNFLIKTENLDSQNSELTFRLQSEYFNTDLGDISVRTDYDLSSTRFVQLDTKVTLPDTDDILITNERKTLVGSVSGSSNNDLKYLWYIPTGKDLVQTNNIMKKMYLESFTDTTTKPSDQTTRPNEDGPVSDYGKLLFAHAVGRSDGNGGVIVDRSLPSESDIGEGLKLYVQDKYSIFDINRITINSHSDIITDPYHKYTGDIDLPSNIDKIVLNNNATLIYTNPSDPYKRSVIITEGTMSNEVLIKYLAIRFLWDEPMIKLLINSTRVDLTREVRTVLGVPIRIYTYTINLSYAIELSRQKIEKINFTITKGWLSDLIALDRKVVFDKIEFNQYLKLNLGLNEKITYKFISQNNISFNGISKIELRSLYADKIVIHTAGGGGISVPLFNADDQSIGVQYIVFA